MNSTKLFLFLDNLRIGGIQRLALDESYAFDRLGIGIEIVVLQSKVPTDDIRAIDGKFFQDNKIIVHHAPIGRFLKIFWLRRFLKKNNVKIAICHSASSIGLIRLASKALRRKIKIIGFLHQLASLSSQTQKFKRFMYFSMADSIKASSKQFILESNSALSNYPFYENLVKRKLGFDRMGVDLGRIDWLQKNSMVARVEGKPALLFNSRTIAWKGFDKFVSLAEYLGEEYQYIVITSSSIHNSELVDKFKQLPDARLYFGLSVAHFSWEVPTIHIYPTDYGPKVNFPQSIGLNVLECLSLGIPSFISQEGFESWPEFRNSRFVREVDWSLVEEVKIQVEKVLLNAQSWSTMQHEMRRIRSIVSIEEHINRLMKEFL